MKLKNKKTGEIDDFIFEVITDRIDLYRRVGHSETKNIWHYNSLAELNEEWQDYEEPREYWYIDIDGEINSGDMEDDTVKDMRKIGNYFETKEEAELAVRKLKAWKRLKDKGFKFTGCSLASDKDMCIFYETDIETWLMQDLQDFKTLFGGEE